MVTKKVIKKGKRIMMKDELITTNQAAAILGEDFNHKDVYTLVKKHILENFGAKRILIKKSQVVAYKESTEKMMKQSVISPFGNVVLDYDESLKILDGIHHPNNIKHPGKYTSSCKYVVSNKGRIFNLNRNIELSQNPVDHGYLSVGLYINKKELSVAVHILTALCWCDNGLLKNEVHHIDGNHLNNNAINLIWLTSLEHKKAHQLFDAAKGSGEWDEYNKFIDAIRKDNQWTQEYRCISFEKEKAVILVWIERSAYNDYLTGKRTLNEIGWQEAKTDIVLRKNEEGGVII